jgi:mono/diheme cytochrome c family protein
MGVATGAVMWAAPSPARAQDASTPVTFTAEQVERGRTVYVRNCQDCHGTTLDNGEFGGAVLKGSYFRQHWGPASAGALYSYTMATMPADRPGQLDPQSYADLTAFLLSQNGYATGDKELPADVDALNKMSLKR